MVCLFGWGIRFYTCHHGQPYISVISAFQRALCPGNYTASLSFISPLENPVFFMPEEELCSKSRGNSIELIPEASLMKDEVGASLSDFPAL